MLVCASHTTIAHETAGASGARHSPRPLFREGGNLMANLGRSARRECGRMEQRHCERSEAIHFRRTKKEWIASSQVLLAMTVFKLSSSTKADDPVFQRRQRWSRGAAAYWGSPACAGDDDRRACMRADPMARNDFEGAGRPSMRPIRSSILTIFWHCGFGAFSSRTASERAAGNEPSIVLAEDSASKGSGNADSQLYVRCLGWSGSRRAHPRDSGCVAAHPASWRAAASYRPLRAVWAVCAWALRGSREIARPLQRS
jgi:hypothetical protein